MTAWNPDLDILLTDSEDDEDILKKEFTGKEAIVFVIDANLFKESNLLWEAMKIIRNAMISGLLINDKDLIGVVFANTEKSPLPKEAKSLDTIVVPKNCAVFLPPRQLTKPIVEHYVSYLKVLDRKFGEDYGIAVPDGCGNFDQMLRLCLNLFNNCGYKLDQSRIVYMTDRNTPHPPNSREYQISMLKAKDLEGREVEFHVIPMIDDFDYDVFYKEFICLVRDIELDSFCPPDAEQLRKILEDRKLKQDFLRRCLGHFSLSLGANLDLSVQYYNYFEANKYPKKVKINRKDNAVVAEKRVILIRKMDEETNEVIEETQIKSNEGWFEINVGEMPIRITPEQMDRIRNLHAPGMKLLGFKPKSCLPNNFFYKPSNFMYPDDKKINGSKKLFRALWERCYEREKIAICLFMRKRKSIPRYVALVPVASEDVKDSKSFRSLLIGDGFKIVYLPMAKHIRDSNFKDWNSIENSASGDGVEFFNKVIKKLTVEYQPQLIVDPTLENLQSNLLALALDIKTENDENIVMSKTEFQDKRIEDYLPDLDTIFGTDVQAKKRSAASSSTAGQAPKVPKIDETDLKSYDYVESLIKDNRIPNCTVAQLREILINHFGIKVPKTATKAVCIERIITEYHK